MLCTGLESLAHSLSTCYQQAAQYEQSVKLYEQQALQLELKISQIENAQNTNQNSQGVQMTISQYLTQAQQC